MNLKTIIFSYNRPAQLDLLLRSIRRFTDFTDIYVTYMHDDAYKAGYQRVIEENSSVAFEKRLKPLKCYIMKELTTPYTMFCPDDDVFIGKVSLKDREFKQFEKNKDILCLSLRLGRNCNYCFDRDIPVKVPKMKHGTWKWKEHEFDWGYPMSCSCTVFRTPEIKSVLDKIDFKIPSHIEAQMWQTPLPQPLMSCYKHQRVLELPINMVQDEFFNNRTGDVSVKWLNDEFMEGKQIDLDYIATQKFNSPQQIAKIRMGERR